METGEGVDIASKEIWERVEVEAAVRSLNFAYRLIRFLGLLRLSENFKIALLSSIRKTLKESAQRAGISLSPYELSELSNRMLSLSKFGEEKKEN